MKYFYEICTMLHFLGMPGETLFKFDIDWATSKHILLLVGRVNRTQLETIIISNHHCRYMITHKFIWCTVHCDVFVEQIVSSLLLIVVDHRSVMKHLARSISSNIFDI